MAQGGDDIGSNPDQGSAYIFVRSGKAWSQQAKLVASDGSSVSGFGCSVSLSADTALVGATGTSNSLNPSPYVFLRSGANWSEHARLVVAGGVYGLGISVSLSGDTAVVGSWSDDAYVFRLSGAAGASCSLASDCAAGYTCVEGVCCTSACGGACDVCSKAKGATADGACTVLPSGTPGGPSCANDVLCDGIGAACPTSCSSDAMCPAGMFCGTTGACLSSRPQGQACAPSECKSGACRICQTGFCVDGFCCDNLCSGSCESCAASSGEGPNGTCGAVTAGTVGAPACPGMVLCDGASRICPTGCTQDSQCPSMRYCVPATGACLPKSAVGVTCQANNECKSSNCVDGVCCNTPCAGSCQACTATLTGSSNGLCANTKAGLDPRDDCFFEAPASCGQTGACDGKGQCQWHSDVSTRCGPDACNGNAGGKLVCVGHSLCGFDPATQNECGAQKCIAGSCAPCVTAADCLDPTASYCDARGVCRERMALGASCVAGEECRSSSCVDGVCCNSACTSLCEACSEALTGAPDGQCANALAGMDPRNQCMAESPATCGRTGLCDGNGGCARHDASTVCGPPACIGAESRSRTCNGSGQCQVAASGTACGVYACDASTGTCLSTCAADDQCSSGNYCEPGTLQCARKTADGATCSSDATCLNAHCIDGVCCESACEAACVACSATKKGQGIDGRCEPIAAASDPDDECPAQSQESCGKNGSCDGAGACAIWPDGTDCAATPGENVCKGNIAVGKVCLGEGNCVERATGIDCAPQKCILGSCAACLTSADCADPIGMFCDGKGACIPKNVPGSTCAGDAQCLSGYCVDGVCCESACQGTCESCADPMFPGICLRRAPGAEACNGVDDNCDGATDEDLALAACGIGACARIGSTCDASSCSPGAPGAETCNGIDDDCDGAADEGCDDDGDGYCEWSMAKLGGVIVAACVQTPASSAQGDDCDDDRASAHPAAAELCNGMDDDCNEEIDEDMTEPLCGVGECVASARACVGGVPAACTPGDPRQELCDGKDNDCNDEIDDGLGDVTCGEGPCKVTVPACSGGAPVLCAPLAPNREVCDGIDNDCNGSADDADDLCKTPLACVAGTCQVPNAAGGGEAGSSGGVSGGAAGAENFENSSVAGAAGSASISAAPPRTVDQPGCGCVAAGRAPRHPTTGAAVPTAMLALLLVALRRFRRSKAAESAQVGVTAELSCPAPRHRRERRVLRARQRAVERRITDVRLSDAERL